MDGLNDQQRVEAWKSCWKISLSGMALLTEDFRFHRVNAQWLNLLGVPASEFYNHTFTDITPMEIRTADTDQARLVIEGKIDSYLMHRSYVFTTGEKKDVTLLVTRVPMDTDKPFQFFLSRIMLRETDAETNSTAKLFSLAGLKKITDFCVEYWKIAFLVGAAAAGAFMTIFRSGQ